MTQLGSRAVVVLEDSDEDFDTAREALAQARLPNQLHRAVTGDACLELLRATALGGLPAFVLLDLNTPGMDGRATLAEIRANVALAAVPVVVLSTSSNPRDIEQCYVRGANAYHIKPVKYADHLRLVANLLTYWLCEVVTSPPEHPSWPR